MTMPASRGLTGGCQCGAVRYELRAPQWTSICHCRMCQKASGQPFMAFTGGDLGKVAFTRGAPKFFRSSEIAERGFCADCGTPLTYGRIGQSLSVTLMSLDDPSALAPEQQNGVESKVGWIDHLDGLKPLVADDWIKTLGRDSAGSRQHPDREA